MIHLWYKNALIYELDVKTFKDSTGSGIGDFNGLSERLPYLAGLGVTCIWLNPFFPSPWKDDGYDISDYLTVDPRLGSVGDFACFTQRARDCGIRVIADLVINHTSDQHPWFMEARRSKTSPFRDYYIWSEEEPQDMQEGIIFPGYQEAIWKWDDEAQAYYHHRFYDFEPDLNLSNPDVQKEIIKVISFWLSLGVSGFRIDAAPFLIESTAKDSDDHPLYDYLRELRQTTNWLKGDAVLLAEANVDFKEVLSFLGEEAQLHMVFNFVLNQQFFLALAQQRAGTLAKTLAKVPKLPLMGQFVNFLRNHDEVDLARLTKKEREFVYEKFGPDESMQIYDRGLRRRLAPMFGGDRKRLELAYSLMFSLPGTPMIRYGDEIAMGENMTLPQRLSVRTPMQWDGSENGGFSRADPASLIRPLPTEVEYLPPHVEVEAQESDIGSFLNWMRQLIRVRREAPELGVGKLTVYESDNDAIMAHSVEHDGRVTLAIHNLSPEPVTITQIFGGSYRKVFGSWGPRSFSGEVEIEIAGYGYCWFKGVTPDK